jgi:hypothetical protein
MKYLTLLGKLDGAITAAAASYALYDPAHVKYALVTAGVAAALGYGLNAVAHFLGGADVVAVKP